MWTCNGNINTDCCMSFEVPDYTVDRRGRVVCTCPFCGALAVPADAEGEAMLQEIIDKVNGR